MERYAPWRNETSTAAQINFLLRLGANSREQDTMKVALTMNKGEVSHTGRLRQCCTLICPSLPIGQFHHVRPSD
jgi:hypothetical protein